LWRKYDVYTTFSGVFFAMRDVTPWKYGEVRGGFWECEIGDFVPALGNEPQSLLDDGWLNVSMGSIQQPVDAVFGLVDHPAVGQVWLREK
jgi:hypothetical protein